MGRFAWPLVLLTLLAGCSTPEAPLAPAPPPAAPAPAVTPAPPPAAPVTSVSPGQKLFVPPEHPHLAVSPTGNWAATTIGLGTRTYGGKSQIQILDLNPTLLSWAPVGDALLAVGKGFALLVHATGGSSQYLTVDAGRDPLVAWSPDGTRALLASYEGPVYEVTVATGQVRQVRPDGGQVVGLDWLAGEKGLLRLKAGSGGAQLVELDLTTGHGKDLGFYFLSVLASDGRHMASAPYMRGELTLTDMTTGEQQVTGRDTRLAEPRPGVEITGHYRWSAHSWSPDATRLGAVLWVDGEPYPMLRLLDLSGERDELVVPGWDGSLVWAPTGAQPIYGARTKDGLVISFNGKVLSTHPEGQSLGLMGRNPGAIFSPTGEQVLYAVELKGRTSTLMLADLRSGKATELPDTNGLSPLLWTPEGDLLVARHAFTRDALPGGGSSEGWTLQGVEPLRPLPEKVGSR